MLKRLSSRLYVPLGRHWYSTPPTYFAGSTPRPVVSSVPTSVPTSVPNSVPTSIATSPTNAGNHVQNPPRKYLLELATVISVLAMSLLAFDSYRVRLKLEAKLEQDAEQFKQTQDLVTKEFNANRKKRELQILNERKRVQTRELKVALHVALLRKQLEDLGIQPASVKQALQEFEKNAKMENSASNVSGTRLWVTENSCYKGYISDVREYD
ncbi:LAFA_0G22166g1_1 [Lachancea sp. 'fantastica']|nr:LAFA_0G22166g1_1 [Lachancea sp. 'fantastica']